MGPLKPVNDNMWAADERQRLDTLKDLIKELHAGKDLDAVKQQFNTHFSNVSGAEIAAMEQQLVAEGMPEEEIARLCDVHVAAFRDVLEGNQPGTATGHPLHALHVENEALGVAVTEMRGLLHDLEDPPAVAALRAHRQALASGLARLTEADRHYRYKENQVFPFLERRGVTAPPKVMWAIHDDIRAALKRVQQALAAEDAVAVAKDGGALLTMISDMVFKEENILFPMCLEKLTEADWAEMQRGGSVMDNAATQREPTLASGSDALAGTAGELPLDTGALSLEQINLILTNLPFDITYVDENDRVRYYTAGKERIFPRTPGIIGREVQRCHPPASVHVVQRILDEFKSGTRDAAEFWLTLGGKFIHVRYFAVRDARGTYRGVIEVTQDITAIRALQGERRLLDWR